MPLAADVLDLYLAITGGLAVVLGLTSRRFRELPLSEPLAALAVGVVVGPAVLDVVALPADRVEEILELSARVVLAISLMAVALRFPTHDVWAERRALTLLLTVVLVGMAAITAGLGALLLGLPLGGALLLGAILAPTDPVLSSSVVAGEPAERTIPERVRLLLSVESGANDGLAFALVGVGVAVTSGRSVPGELGSAALQLAIALALGSAAGWGTGKLLLVAERHRDVEHATFLALTIALSLFVLGATDALGGQGVVAVLVAGLAYNSVISRSDRAEEWEVQEAINQFLVLPVFVLFGMALPWDAWATLSGPGLAFAVVTLLLRRPPLLLATRPLLGPTRPEALFLGWFGPIGVAALFYLAEARQLGVVPDTLWAAGTLTVTLSTLVHGVSATPLRRRLARAER